jgi:ribose transport system substrate-binding protein
MARHLGWNLHLIDGWRAASRRAEAINQAIALQPDGTVHGTIDADEQAAVTGAAAAKSVTVVDWPCSRRPTSISTTGRKGPG